MREIGQPVDDRHAGVARHVLDLGVIVGADHDRIDIGRQHARGVGDALAATQLHRPRIHDDRGAAQLPDRHVEADAGARRILLEDHRQHMAGERRVGIGTPLGKALARRLAVDRIGQHRGDAIGAGIGQVQEMTHRNSFFPSPPGRERELRSSGRVRPTGRRSAVLTLPRWKREM
jgi:hypothetical protein